MLEHKHTLSHEGKKLQLADNPNAGVLLPSEWTLDSSKTFYINHPFGARVEKQWAPSLLDTGADTRVSWHTQRLTSGGFYLGHTFLICKTLRFGVYRHAGPKNNPFLYPNSPFRTGQPSGPTYSTCNSKAALPAYSLSTLFKPTPLVTPMILRLQ